MIEENKIYNMDCLEGLKQMEKSSVDLVITSPPYNCDIQYDEWNDNLDEFIYYQEMEKIIREIYRVLKDDGRVCWNVTDLYFNKSQAKENLPRVAHFITLFQKVGFKFWIDIIWHQTDNNKLTAWGSWLSASSPYIYCDAEHIIILYKKSRDKLTKGESDITKDEFINACKSTIWQIRPVVTKRNSNDCPVPFPKKLIRRLIKLFSYKNDLVLDPFSGRGTTCIIAKENERRFIGFEISKSYFKLSKDRNSQEYLHQHLKNGSGAKLDAKASPLQVFGGD
jgi:site-specific DNA-methyltransferase (adenine-specific)